jgi:hypothetical protein
VSEQVAHWGIRAVRVRTVSPSPEEYTPVYPRCMSLKRWFWLWSFARESRMPLMDSCAYLRWRQVRLA